MSDPRNECGPWSRVGLEWIRNHRKARRENTRKNIHKSTSRTMLGIELPFDWCLVRGSELRRLQSELRQARFDAGVRSRMCGYLLKQIYRKDSR